MEDRILLAHGSGGELMHKLIRELFVSQFKGDGDFPLDDGAELILPSERVAFSTDSYVVKPLFFPGGDIGRLAVFGTVNDLSMKGARPLYISVSFIIEEGLEISVLRRVVESIAAAAREAGVRIVTGDTKVVERGGADGLFINTSGVGSIPEGVSVSGRNARPGDAVILSGSIGRHGMAVMSQREGLEFDSPIESDCAPLNGLVELILGEDPGIHVLRDPTRGGVATSLNEIADQSGVGIFVDESSMPLEAGVSAACEILGLDPLYVANEGVLIAVVEPTSAKRIIRAMRNHPLGADASVVGEVMAEPRGVFLRTRIGGTRVVPMLRGEQLPRIC
ncbi:MAG: hydrogenase expression/formation protein HypE [bacterium]